MTPQELQNKVANLCGWTHLEEIKRMGYEGKRPYGYPPVNFIIGKKQEIPPYATSLDAIQKAALEKFKSGPECATFSQRLEFQWINKTTRQSWWQLTALDWCEAFVKTCDDLK